MKQRKKDLTNQRLTRKEYSKSLKMCSFFLSQFLSTCTFYWLNRACDGDHRRFMMKQFHGLGIQRHIRIDLTDLSHNIHNRNEIEGHLHALFIAYKDNMKNIKNMKNINNNNNNVDTKLYTIILTDDVVLTNESLEQLVLCINNLPEDWEVFQGHISNPVLYEKILKEYYEENRTLYPNYLLPTYFQSTACYVMKNSSISKLISLYYTFTNNTETQYRLENLENLKILCTMEDMIYSKLRTYSSLYSCFNRWNDNKKTADSRNMLLLTSLYSISSLLPIFQKVEIFQKFPKFQKFNDNNFLKFLS